MANALQDPTLAIFDVNGAQLASNDDWATNEDGSSQVAQIQATAVAPTDARESAILTSLAPANYTAIVRGKNGATGVALVEVYSLP